MQGSLASFSLPLCLWLSDDGTARVEWTADTPTKMRDVRLFEKTEGRCIDAFSHCGTANLAQSVGFGMFYVWCVLIISQCASIHDCAVGGHICVSTEGCVVEHTEQDGEVRIHAPLWRRLIISIATCLVILAQGSEQRAQADAFQTQGLRSCEQECCLLTSLRQRFSPRSPLCSMLGVTKSHPYQADFSPLARFVSTNLKRVSHKAQQKHVPITRDVPQRSTKTPT